jgi:hypothetical protein
MVGFLSTIRRFPTGSEARIASVTDVRNVKSRDVPAGMTALT